MTKNFKYDEFKSSDGAPTPFEAKVNLERLARQLQFIRDVLDEPININSAYRSPEHNKAIGGVSNSKHILGLAADLSTSMKPEYLYETIEMLIESEHILEGGLGLYDTFVHYDIRGTKARWDNRTKK